MSLCTCKSCGCHFANLETAACPGCYQAALSYAELLTTLLKDARAEVIAQMDFHGCDNCNLTSANVVERIDAVLAKNPAPTSDSGAADGDPDSCSSEPAGGGGRSPAECVHETCHTDHPLRHWDRTCPACVHETNAERPEPHDCSWCKTEHEGYSIRDCDAAAKLRHQSGKKPTC